MAVFSLLRVHDEPYSLQSTFGSLWVGNSSSFSMLSVSSERFITVDHHGIYAASAFM